MGTLQNVHFCAGPESLSPLVCPPNAAGLDNVYAYTLRFERLAAGQARGKGTETAPITVYHDKRQKLVPATADCGQSAFAKGLSSTTRMVRITCTSDCAGDTTPVSVSGTVAVYTLDSSACKAAAGSGTSTFDLIYVPAGFIGTTLVAEGFRVVAVPVSSKDYKLSIPASDITCGGSACGPGK